MRSTWDQCWANWKSCLTWAIIPIWWHSLEPSRQTLRVGRCTWFLNSVPMAMHIRMFGAIGTALWICWRGQLLQIPGVPDGLQGFPCEAWQQGTSYKLCSDRASLSSIVILLLCANMSHLTDLYTLWRTRLSKFHGGAPQSSSLTTKDLVRWAYEVASGMEYVSSKNVRDHAKKIKPSFVHSLPSYQCNLGIPWWLSSKEYSADTGLDRQSWWLWAVKTAGHGKV